MRPATDWNQHHWSDFIKLVPHPVRWQSRCVGAANVGEAAGGARPWTVAWAQPRAVGTGPQGTPIGGATIQRSRVGPAQVGITGSHTVAVIVRHDVDWYNQYKILHCYSIHKIIHNSNLFMYRIANVNSFTIEKFFEEITYNNHPMLPINCQVLYKAWSCFSTLHCLWFSLSPQHTTNLIY